MVLDHNNTIHIKPNKFNRPQKFQMLINSSKITRIFLKYTNLNILENIKFA